MWRLLQLSPGRVAIAIAWGVAALGSGLALAALAAWLIARAWGMPPVLDLSIAVVLVRALGISRGVCRYLERLATHDVALRAMNSARVQVYSTLARADIWWWRDRGEGVNGDGALGRGSRDGANGPRGGVGAAADGGGARIGAACVDGARGSRGAGAEGEARGGDGAPLGGGRGMRDGARGGVGAAGDGAETRIGVAGARDGCGAGGTDEARGGGPDGDGSGAQVGSIPSGRRDGRTAGSSRQGWRGDADGGAREMRAGDLLVRVGADIDDLGAVVVRTFVPVAVAVVLAVAAVGLIGSISVVAGVVLAGALVVAGILGPWLSAYAARVSERAVRVERGEFTARALTVLDHAAELRVAGRLDAALASADDASRAALVAEDRAASRSAWAAAAGPFALGVSAFGALLVGIAIYGPTGGEAGGMTPMALAILVLVPLSAFEAVGALPAAATTFTTSRAAYHRLMSLVPSADSGQRRAVGDAVSVPLAVRAGLGDGRADSDDADASAAAASADMVDRTSPDSGPEGKRVAVVGASGAGKTTLLMEWAGLRGVPKPGVTFFAEDAHLFTTSVLENLRVARGDLAADEAVDALNAVGLGEWLDSLEAGVHTVLSGGADAVSGGQRRRILLARALISPARTLLLDEPTEHLDATEGDALLRALLDVDSGLVAPERTVVVVTHQLPTDHRADEVITVVAGQSGKENALRALTAPS
ncbi:thiol reductant ABC exporter subunit CydC [Nocardia camponoti]|nr:thiol reductant ABC exporter subunit CydC [Nocardia camponoti]